MNATKLPIISADEHVREHVTEHAHLEKVLATLQSMIAERKVECSEVIIALTNLLTNIHRHFEHEEQAGGFFETVVKQAPRLSEQAGSLTEEHRCLAESLQQAIKLAQKDSPPEEWWTALAAQHQKFHRSFIRHERSENELLQTAFSQDIGDND